MSARRRPLPAPSAPAADLVLPIPTGWARERIAAAGGPLPDYGSSEWHALADDDPRKLAAACVAAEVHRYEAATLAERLAREIAETRHAVAVEELHDEIADGARAAAARDEALADAARKVGGPSFAALQAERYGPGSDAARAAFERAAAIAETRWNLRSYRLPRRRRAG